MTNSVLLLKIIKVQGNLTLLRSRGLSNSQIAMLIKENQQNGNVILTDVGISLTEQGENFLKSALSETTAKPKDMWIVKQEHYYKEPLSLKTIVLPKKKKI